MKVRSLRKKLIVALSAVCCTALAVAFGLACQSSRVFAEADGNTAYNQSYRNKLAFSAEKGWNNDPNGLLYANGVYHMYYQYNWDKKANGGAGATANGWGFMSWGHATSSDLVHWSEQPVAIPAVPTGKFDKDGREIYDMMFSGSAVYDENNTSGLFETDGSTGKIKDGQGIVAILTQPNEEAGGQRQILAYSKDNGQSFEIYGEILGADDDGGVGDGEFRDPKVFWSEAHEKWLMVVGGGSVRMYSSVNLKDWTYLGQTGYWGECPDISRFEVNGGQKYVLIISPEDKAKSHEYNKTDRAGTYYPAEYYAVGDLNGDGLFVSDSPVRRLSEGIDSYAFQSFNNSPDGKVYGVSWSASWKTTGEYEAFRKVYNGGMTVVCELRLEERDGVYSPARYPVAAYDGLRGAVLKEFDGELKAGENAFGGVVAREADIVAELDFNGSGANFAEMALRVSAAEQILLKYDLKEQSLTLDRSRSSLLAEDTSLYKAAYRKEVPLADGKLSLRILLDRAFISVFANGGAASYFSAVFPSAISDGLSLVSDGNIAVRAEVYSVNGIFGNVGPVDELVLSASKIDTTVGATETLTATSFAGGFNSGDVEFTVIEGNANVTAERENGVIYIRPQNKGFSKLQIKYKGQTREVEIYIYDNGLTSGVEFDRRLGGFSLIADDGLHFETGTSDAFLFGNSTAKDLSYSAVFKPLDENSQAGGLVFGVSENLTDYWVATADLKDKKVKLWKSGVGDLKVADYAFDRNAGYKLGVTVFGDAVKIYIDDASVLSHNLENYRGGYVGLNVYNSKMSINRIALGTGNGISVGTQDIVKVVNVTDGSHRLSPNDYSVEDGYLSVSEQYLSTLEADREYTFRVITSDADFDFVIKTNFEAAQIYSVKEEYAKGENLAFTVTEDVAVNRLEIDGKAVEFTRQGSVISVSAENIKNLISGEHTVKAYTTKGRLSLTINLAAQEDYREDEIEIISHTFFYIDIAIFAAAIIAYVAVTVTKKVMKRRHKNV